MTTKHTPGPWIADQCSDGRCHVYGIDGILIPAIRGNSAGQQLANSHLIAAAPDLLEALRNMVIAADNLDPQSGIPIGYEQLVDAVTFADAAIAKATGAA